MGGPGMKSKPFRFLGLLGLALVLRQIEATAQWPQGLLDALYCYDSEG